MHLFPFSPDNARLISRLRDPETAQAYLDAALSEYQDGGDIGALLVAIRHLAEAQGTLSRATPVSLN